jgi:N-acetylneuraminate lyase
VKKTIEDFRGVIPAVLSVFDEQENLDDQGTREFIRFLMSFPIGGLYLTGSTGETFLMNEEERMHQVEVAMDEVGDRVPVVVHVGAMSTRASVKLAKQAAAAGAAGVSSVPPFYYKYSNDQIFGYYKDIAEETDLPMIVYNIPLAGMMTVDMIRRLSEIANVKGVKYTGTAIYEVTQIKDRCKDGFRVYGGCDELGSSNIALGVDGIIGSFYNVIPDLYTQIWEAVKSGRVEEATRLQHGALHVISAGLGSGSIMACLKLWLRSAGVPAGYARRPFDNFSEEERARLVRTLLDIDHKEKLGLEIVKRIEAEQ